MEKTLENIDFLAIGDIVTDAFIRLKDADLHDDMGSEVHHVQRELCVRYGDKVPYESVTIVRAVGNSANAAISASRLGITSALMAVVGDDDEGKKNLEVLKANNVLLDYMTIDTTLPTNYHYVLWYQIERTILVKHSPFERHIPKDLIPPKWIYLTSLGENTEAFHHEIALWLKNHPETKLAFQPGTFQIKLGKDKLADIYRVSDIFYCNIDEAQRILATEEIDCKKLMDMLHALGPKIIILTDGVNGAYARDFDNSYYFVPAYPNIPFERTGAGDAFESTITVCLAMGKTLPEALLWAPINAMSVTEHIGAQEGLLSREKLEEYLKNAPKNYTVTKL